ncbi:MAG: bifunctional serine/threonine-protein kinase/formylglycine-generating enzyme family protein [Pyrinomonadaceae bacterium]
MLRKGEQVGPYTLMAKLGRGGFGVVWLAEKRTSLAVTQVALKIPHDEDIDLEAVRREAAVWITASGHPNVLPIIDADIYDDLVVIVSEYAPDGSLESWLRKHGGRAPSVEEAIEITDDILAGLEHLHSRRIIHRDLKPANVLLQGRTPRLVDFGLARVLRSTSHSKTVSGTYAYMPPETFDGQRSEQTDIWSAGVMLYEMLTGHLPFPNESDAALIGAILHKAPQPLPNFIGSQLRDLVMSAVSKDLNSRFRSATAMRAALRQVGGNSAVDTIARNRHPRTNPVGPPLAPARPEATTDRTLPETLVLPGGTLVTEESILPEPVPTVSSPVIPLGLVSPPREPANFNKWLPLIIVGSLVTAFVILLVVALAGVGIFGKLAKLPAVVGKPPTTFKSQHGIEFVNIPAGSFDIGAPDAELEREADEGPVKKVTFAQNFYLGKYEVTQTQWQEAMGNNPSSHVCPKCPVEMISWDDAKQFIAKLNGEKDGYTYRLPSEAEFEYATRAGTTTRYYWGDDLLHKDQCLYGNGADLTAKKDNSAWRGADCTDGFSTTAPAGSFQPNKWGLFDMLGNVGEWCEDVYVPNYVNLPLDGSPNLTVGDPTIRVLRSSTYYYHEQGDLRSANRDSVPVTNRGSGLGLRLVAIPVNAIPVK